jgi:2-phospho-L-lactate guanylyltransferase
VNAQPRIYAVVPVKDPAVGKTRLAPILDAGQRRELCLFLAKRTLEFCAEAFGAECTIVVTAAPDVARWASVARVQVVPEPAGENGLNAAIFAGAAQAHRCGAAGLLVVPADLALLTVDELRAAANAIPATPGCLIVPDRRDSGTNMLGLAPFREGVLAFGEGSLKRHSGLARRAGYEVRIHRSAALALDLDLPGDYASWRRETQAESERLPFETPLQY